jgi:hypothetical protein
VLKKRCQTPQDKAMVNLMLRLHMKQRTTIGKFSYDSGRGVAQVSVLSPLLFNIVLEEALLSSKLLNQLIGRGDLMAYADDIIVQSKSTEELKMALTEIGKLESEWGLKLNLKKCEFLLHKGAKMEETHIAGVKIS